MRLPWSDRCKDKISGTLSSRVIRHQLAPYPGRSDGETDQIKGRPSVPSQILTNGCSRRSTSNVFSVGSGSDIETARASSSYSRRPRFNIRDYLQISSQGHVILHLPARGNGRIWTRRRSLLEVRGARHHPSEAIGRRVIRASG